MILETTASAPYVYSSLPSQAISPTAIFIAEQCRSGLTRLQESLTFGLHGKSCALSDLQQVYEECHNPDWDGYGALPITETTYELAKELIDALPLGTPLPSIGSEPDGHITFEWYLSLRKTLSVSVSPEGELHYAALLGTNKVYGTETFYGDAPKKIVDLIYEVTS